MIATAKRTLVLLAAAALVIGPSPAPPASAAPGTLCHFEVPEYPHISGYNLRRKGSIDIKTSGSGTCGAIDAPGGIRATMKLEKQGFLGFWDVVATGEPIEKSLTGTPQVWRRGELFAIRACEPGVYRGRIEVSGVNGYYFGFDAVSVPQTIDCNPSRISMVIDDTGSMGGVIGSVKSALSTYITSQPEDEYTRWSLTTFKDSARDIGSTEERSEILGWVDALAASGGGDCPEDVLGGITSGLSALGTGADTDKQMLVATDASAQAGDVDGIIARARASGVRVNVLLTGDCEMGLAAKSPNQGPVAKAAEAPPLSSQVVLKRIAQETGGKYFFLPSGTTDDFIDALNKIFTAIAHPAPPSPTASPRPSGAPTASPSGGVTPSPTASPTPDTPGLPVTGRSVISLIVISVVLIAAGAVLLFRFRRRRLA